MWCHYMTEVDIRKLPIIPCYWEPHGTTCTENKTKICYQCNFCGLFSLCAHVWFTGRLNPLGCPDRKPINYQYCYLLNSLLALLKEKLVGKFVWYIIITIVRLFFLLPFWLCCEMTIFNLHYLLWYVSSWYHFNFWQSINHTELSQDLMF